MAHRGCLFITTLGLVVLGMVGPTEADIIGITIDASLRGTAADAGADGSFETLDTVTTNTVAQIFGGTEKRPVYEFDLSSVPDVTLTTAIFREASTSLGVQDPGYFDLYGYAGDGVLTASDALNTTTLLDTVAFPCCTGPLFFPGFDTDVRGFIEPLLGTSSFAGFVIRQQNPNVSGYVAFYGPRRLTITYDDSQIPPAEPVPEPSTWLLLGTGLGMVAYRRRRKRS